MQELRVAAIEEPAPGVRTLLLERPDGAPLPPFAPGSHVELRCGERTNAYSLTGDPRETRRYAVSVLRVDDGRGGSAWLHEAVEPGQAIAVGPPRSSFAPPAAARHHLLIGAGIGITPFLSYVPHFERRGISYELHHVHRAAHGPHGQTAAVPADRLHLHAGRAAFAAALPALLDGAAVGTHLSICGPPAMIDEVLDAARARGWPEGRLHSERFAGVEAPPGTPFVARLARSGTEVAVAAGEPLLDALERIGADVPSLCRQGVCGECRVPVLAGEPEHHDLYLSDEERAAGTAIMPCVSRCGSTTLELDL